MQLKFLMIGLGSIRGVETCCRLAMATTWIATIKGLLPILNAV